MVLVLLKSLNHLGELFGVASYFFMSTAWLSQSIDEDEDVCPICIDVYMDPVSLTWLVVQLKSNES